MPFALDLGVCQVPLMELPIDLLDRAAKAHGIKWHEFLSAPARHVGAGRELVRLAAEHVGVDVPDTSTVRRFTDLWVEVGDDVNEIVWVDGHPKAGRVTSTAG